MKYVAHLSTGETVDVEIDGDENLFAHIGEPSNNRNAGWLVGNKGEMINLDYCAALVPVLTDVKPIEPARPNALVDGMGGWWRLQENGEYRLFAGTQGSPCGLGETYEEIQRVWGIDHIVN